MKNCFILAFLAGGLVSLTACSSTSPPRSKWQKGYSAGMADAAKRQYFAQRNLYKYEFDCRQQKRSVHRYSFEISPDLTTEIKRVPYTITIPVEQ